jgi:hypothetical protein
MIPSQKEKFLWLVNAYGRDSVCRIGSKNSGDLENDANGVDYALGAFASSGSGLYAEYEVASGDRDRYLALTCIRTLILYVRG